MAKDLTVGLEEFDASDEHDIRRLAKGMTIEEIANWYGLEFPQLCDADQKFLRAYHMRGRKGGVEQAVEELFAQMKVPKTGGQIALSYLSKFADDFPEEGVAATQSGFNFRVIMDND